MEFAVCPACGQSVLDDDAESCPFCGSSMKAKPGAKPAPQAPKTPQPAAKAAVKGPAKPAADDSPFDVMGGIGASAVPAARQATKGRPFKVVCPMCETVGYVPTSAAGKEVKCANPQCLVPIFTAPLPEPEPAPAPPPKKSGNLIVLGLITALVVGGIGAAAYFMVQPTGSPDQLAAPIAVAPVTPSKTSNATQTETDPAQQPAATTPATTPIPAGPSAAELTASALQESQQASLLQGSRNRSKPLCRRLAAEAYAVAGDLNGARQQIEALVNVGPQLPFYQVTPWLEVFWQERKNGRTIEATAALDKAVAAAGSLPTRGREQLDTATRLAVALVVSGRVPAARDLISAHQANDLDGEMSPQFLWLAANPGVTDVHAIFDLAPLAARRFPQAAAVAGLTVAHGEPSAAREYAQSWSDLDVRAECVASLAEAFVWLRSSNAVTDIESLLGDLTPAARAMTWARAARVAAATKQPALAEQAVTRASAAIDEVQVPEEYLAPDTKALVRNRPEFDQAALRAAAAAAEIAVAHLEIGSPSESSGAMLERSLQFARALGPALPAAIDLQDAANKLGVTALRNQIKSQLELRNDDEARQSMGLYRRSLNDLEGAARARFELQAMILSRAAQAGLEDAVWTIVSSRNSEDDVGKREPYLNTDVAVQLHQRFHATKDEDRSKALAAVRQTASLPEPKTPPAAVFAEQIAAGRYAEAWQTVSQSSVKSDLKEALLLKAVIRTAAQPGKLEATWKLIGPINDIVLREQAIDWAARMAARSGQAQGVWSHVKSLSAATEIVSLAHGMVFGLRDAEQPATTTAPATTAAR